MPTDPTTRGIEVLPRPSSDAVRRARPGGLEGVAALPAGPLGGEVRGGHPGIRRVRRCPKGSRHRRRATSASSSSRARTSRGTSTRSPCRSRTSSGRSNAGEGLLGQMLHDPEFGKEGLAAISKASLENLEALTDAAARRAGVRRAAALSTRVRGPRSTDLDQPRATSPRRWKPCRGARARVGALLDEGGAGEAGDRGPARRAGLAAPARRERLDVRNGLIGRLLYDQEYSEALARDLQRDLAQHRSEITRQDQLGPRDARRARQRAHAARQAWKRSSRGRTTASSRAG